MLYGPLVHVGKTLTDLQILSCELHKNVIGGWAPPGPVGGAIVLLPDLLAIIRGGEGEKGKGLGIVGSGGREGERKVVKG